MNGSLTDVRHVLFVDAERVAASSQTALADRSTQCRAHHVSASGEDVEAMWAEYLGSVESSGFSVSVNPSVAHLTQQVASGRLHDVTCISVDAAGLASVLAALEEAPGIGATTLVAVALGGGDALPVVSERGRLGDAGLLLLLSPWTPPNWVSEEVVDHTSVMRWCELWTAARGREVRADIPNWRRELCGDLHRMVDIGSDFTAGALPRVAGRRLARAVPYFPVADVLVDDSGVTLRVGNIGPTAQSPVPLIVQTGGRDVPLVVAASPLDDQSQVRLPIPIERGAYDVTVIGPNHFRRRFAGTFPNVGIHCTAEYFGQDPWFPSLTLTVWHDQNLPIFFWLERRLGERAASKSAAYGSGRFERLPGPRQSARFREEPGANTFGWYDVAVTSNADPLWVREYSGHMPTGARPTLDF